MLKTKSFSITILLILVGCDAISSQYDIFNKDITDLKKIDSLVLSENYPVILHSIHSISLNPEKGLIALTNPYYRQLALFDYNNGNLIKHYTTYFHYTDSVAFSNIEVQKYEFDPNRYSQDYQYCTLEDLTIKSNNPMDSTILNHNFTGISWSDDKLFTSIITYFVIESKSIKQKIMSNITLPQEIDIQNDNRQFITAKKDSNILTMPGNIHITNDDIIITAYDGHFQETNNLYDSLPTAALISKSKDKKLELISFLPESYCSSKIGYNFLWEPKIFGDINDVFFAYELDKYVYNSKNEIVFEFKDLPYENKKGFEYFKENKVDILKLEFYSKDSTLRNIFPIRLHEAFYFEGQFTFLFIVVSKKESSKYSYLIQKYNSDGELLLSKVIFNEKHNYKNVSYDAYNDLIITLSKDQSWIMEKWKL